MTDPSTLLHAAFWAAAVAFKLSREDVWHGAGREDVAARRSAIVAVMHEAGLPTVYAARKAMGLRPMVSQWEREGCHNVARKRKEQIASIRQAIAPLCVPIRPPSPEPAPPRRDPWDGADFSRHNLTPRQRGAFGKPAW